jgi:serine/threonine protein kinase
VRHGRYTIIRKIAEGGMAEIFLAKQHGSEGFEKLVILKRILTAFFADEQFRNMLIDEAHISMGLSHNNIAQIFDVGKASGRFFLVLELVDGWDLGRLMQRAEKAGTPLPPGLGIYILSEVCRALSYAHAKTDGTGRALAIVHRDVSPHNVLISEQGEVKIIDFGVAKAMTKRDRTGAGIVKGKLAFMSPEQASGQAIDARSDLYAVGILLYLLCTGRRPYDGPTDMEVLVRVQSGQFVPPEQRSPEMSRAVAYVINKAMSADRDRRYQSADELLTDLEEILREEYGASGQTALKSWLAQLARRDGELPISRNQSTRFSKPGSESVEGKSVELGDDEEDDLEPQLGRLEVGGGRLTEPTMRNVVVNRRSLPAQPRITGSEVTSLSDLAMSVPDDGPRNMRPTRQQPHSASDMSLSVAEDERPVHLRERSGGRGFVRAVVMLGVLGGAGYGIWRFLNGPPSDPAAEVEATATPPAAPAAGTPPAPTGGATGTAAAPAAPTPAPAAGTPAAAAAADDKTDRAEKPEKKPEKPRERAEKPVHERAHAPDPYARARSWQKPEEPISPGIEVPTPPPAPAPKPEDPAPAPSEGTTP